MEDVEIAIIGGGAVGLAAAWRLAAAGREVLLIERFDLGHDRGSSHGPTRIFRFAYDMPDYVRMAQAALPLWRELEQSSGKELLRITGGLDVGNDTYLKALETALTKCGAAAERLDAGARKKRFGWLEAGDEPAVYSPDTGVLAAARALEAMASAARAGGAEIRERAPVEQIDVQDDAVTLDIAGEKGEEIRARRCIVAAGAWARPLLAQLSIPLPVTVTREQVFYFHAPDDVVPFIYRGDIDRYGVPAFAGAPGVKVAEHGTGERTSADGRSDDMDPEGEARVAEFVERVLPGFDSEPVAFETCLYTTTPDEDFVLDTRGPIVIASACSGHGFKFAPIVGEILACMTIERRPPIPLDRFRLSRFA
jgi:sarcosine oxidase